MGGWFDTRGFKVSPVPVLDGVRYPPLRLRRRETAAAFGLEELEEGAPLPAPLPNVRLWPFEIQDATIGQRATAVSPLFAGPALLDFLRFSWSSGVANQTPTLSIYYATDAGGQGSSQADTLIPSGTAIFEPITNASDTAFTFRESRGIPTRGAEGVNVWETFPLEYIIRAPSFRLKISMDNQAAGGMAVAGYVRLLEALDLKTFRLR